MWKMERREHTKLSEGNVLVEEDLDEFDEVVLGEVEADERLNETSFDRQLAKE